MAATAVPRPGGPRHSDARGRRGPGTARPRPRTRAVRGVRGIRRGPGGDRPARFDRPTAIAARPRARPVRRRRPGPPPPPLSKDALAGNVPLRTFGQLKQLWEARDRRPEPGRIGPARGSAAARGHQPSTAPEPTMHSPEPPESPHRRRRRRNPRRRRNRSNPWRASTTSGSRMPSRCRSVALGDIRRDDYNSLSDGRCRSPDAR